MIACKLLQLIAVEHDFCLRAHCNCLPQAIAVTVKHCGRRLLCLLAEYACPQIIMAACRLLQLLAESAHLACRSLQLLAVEHDSCLPAHRNCLPQAIALQSIVVAGCCACSPSMLALRSLWPLAGCCSCSRSLLTCGVCLLVESA